MEASTWIDRATGITLQTRSVGASFADVGEKRTPLTETVTLSELVVDEPMPADFPPVAPPGVEVARSGDPTEFGTDHDRGGRCRARSRCRRAVRAGRPGVDVNRCQVENADGGDVEVVPTLIVRWFDGFSATELRVARTPSFQPPAPCVDCNTTLLEQLQGAPLAAGGVYVWVDQIQVSIVGDPERIRAIVDSLVTIT